MEPEAVDHTLNERRLGRLPSGTEITVPVHRYAGGAGPTVYVQALQHGIEVNGPAVLRRFHERLVDATLAGTVVVVPVANPLAFDHRTYSTPPAYDALNPNLNRVWPGDENGTLQERVAANLWPVVSGADAVVDLHTGLAEMLEHARFPADDADARALATAFGTEYLVVDRDTTPADAAFRGRLRTAVAREGVPAVTVELSNSRRVTYEAVQRGVDGLRNVLRELDVLGGTPADPPAQSVLRDDAADTMAGESGLFEPRPDVSVGDRVREGDVLGTTYSPATFEERETVTAAGGGVVYSMPNGTVTIAGERLVGVARPVG